MDFSVSGNSLVLSLVGIAVVIIGIILVIRNVYSGKSSQGLADKYEGKSSKSPLEGRSKYPEVDVFRLSGTFFNFGLMAAVGLTILAFSWTTYEDEVIIPEGALELDDEIEIEPPRTAEPPPPPPPSPRLGP